jgi:hypothetical protein
MKALLDRYAALRAPEGGGNGGGEGGGNGGGGNGDGDGSGGALTLPDGFPDQFKGSTLEESLGKLLGGFTETNTRMEGLRTKLGQLPKAPDKPDAYTYEPSERVKPFVGDIAKDPVFGQARTAFHKHGVSQDQFAGIMEDLYAPLIEQGLISQPFNPKAEVDTFMTANGLDRTGAQAALVEAESFAKGLGAQLKGVPEALKPDVQAALISLTDTAAGNVLLRALSGRLQENGIRIAGESTVQGEISADELKKLDADPRIDPRNREHKDPDKRFDPALRARYDAAYQKQSAGR